jgi:hypothetical protein
MKILVTAKHISGEAREGGSSRFMKCVIDTLKILGHEVLATTNPKPFVKEKFDLIICSHLLNAIKENPAYKVYIAHGIIGEEYFYPGADRYISVSDEVRDNNLWRGISSEVIGQPIVIGAPSWPGKRLKKILVIRREAVAYDPFAFLAEKYNLRYSDLSIPIEKQIAWADLCITLGRGALEAMAQGKAVLVADNRPYIGAYGDGYISPGNIMDIAKNNFSGRRFKFTLTRGWIESELRKYRQRHAPLLYSFVAENYEAEKIVKQYLKSGPEIKIGFGVLVNDMARLGVVLRQSEIDGKIHTIARPSSAVKGLNKLLGIMEKVGYDIGILTHQDMFYRNGWLDRVKDQIGKLPDSWIVAGIIGKDAKGKICGRLHDMRLPQLFNSTHRFPTEASCFDECCIIINLKKGFRFDEKLDGFDLYGTLCVLQAQEMGGTAWMLDAFAEHYCMRPFTWCPDKTFEASLKWLFRHFPNAKRIDSTVFGYMGKKSKKVVKQQISIIKEVQLCQASAEG